MNPEKIGNFIKKLRKDNDLTQKDLADKYGVTYQAVSKWERGLNIPDVSLIRQMSKDFNIPVEDILDGKISNKNNKKKKVLIIFSIIVLVLIITLVLLSLIPKNTFNFKTITTTCDEFKVSGSIAYNKDKTSIYISNIDYCKDDDNEVYKEIECNLYENNNDTTKLISKSKSKKNITIEDYLKDLTLNIEDYDQVCKNYTDNSLYLEIKGTNKEDKVITYRIPLKLNNNC